MPPNNNDSSEVDKRPILLANLSDRGDRILAPLNEKFHVVLIKDIFNSQIYDIPVIGTLFKALTVVLFCRRNNPAAFLEDSFGTYTIVEALISKVSSTPFIIRPRGGMWGEFGDEGQTRGVRNAFWYGVKKETIRNIILTLSSGVISVSYFQRLQILCELNLHPSNIRVVHEPINKNPQLKISNDEFKASYGLPEEATVITTVTNFNYRLKYLAIFYFLSGFTKALESNKDAYIVVAGGGSHLNSAKDQLYKCIPPELRDRFLILGYLDSIEELYSDTDIYVHTSFRDSMGQPILEAQSAQIPTMTNDGGGMTELLYDGGQNQVFREPEEMASMLNGIIEEGVNYDIEDAAEWVNTEFSDSKIAEQFESEIEYFI